ncbi:DMAC1 protein, partial [Smithornis capensis]|nr:DMAC1 protein [Smithornis capensis]
AAMSRGAEAAAGAGSVSPPGPGPSPRQPLFGGCLSCRFVCGTGLVMAGVWLYQGPRKSMKRGIPPSLGAIAQITFAISEGTAG